VLTYAWALLVGHIPHSLHPPFHWRAGPPCHPLRRAVTRSSSSRANNPKSSPPLESANSHNELAHLSRADWIASPSDYLILGSTGADAGSSAVPCLSARPQPPSAVCGTALTSNLGEYLGTFAFALPYWHTQD
jgi:hypothetical protein